jgi:hypothetical protein
VNSYLTQDELNELIFFHILEWNSSPPLYRFVSNTQLSIARYYGSMKINGHHYTYMPATDELIRDDVLKIVATMRKNAQKEKAKQASENQIGLL